MQNHVQADAKLKRRSRVAARFCRLFAVLIPALVLMFFYVAGGVSILFWDTHGVEAALTAPPWQNLVASGVAMTPPLCAAAALLAAARCLDRFAVGEWFDEAAAAHVRSMGAWIAASGPAALIVETINGLILTLHAGDSEKALVIDFGSDEVLALLFGCALWLIGDVMRRAAALARDNAAII